MLQNPLPSPRCPATSAQLAAALQRLGVSFLFSPLSPLIDAPLDSASLIAGLAASPEARLRQALIPLLLWRPDLAHYARQAEPLLPPRPRLFLQCYYTAAMLLQNMYASSLRLLGAGEDALPDLFSSRLGLSQAGDAHQRLARLAQRQAQLSGEQANWLGTYQHAASTFIHHLERETVWSR
jgi:hypothetical protein